MAKEVFPKICKGLQDLWKSYNFYFNLDLKRSYVTYGHSRMFTLGI